MAINVKGLTEPGNQITLTTDTDTDAIYNNVKGLVKEYSELIKELDKLYKAVLDDNTEENINAWDQCFTYDNCYGYAVCCFYTQTACKSEYNAALFGNQNQLAPGAFTLAK